MEAEVRKINTLEEEKINEIGHAFGYYEYKDGELGMSRFYRDKESVSVFITQYVRMALKAGTLYSVGEPGAGYISLNDSDARVPAGAAWELLKGFFCAMSLGEIVRVAKAMSAAGTSLSDRMKKQKERHLFVGLVCVSEKYQGMGYMRKLLDFAFQKGREENLPVVLDTDAKSKCDRYLHLGMELAGTRVCPNGVILYDLVKYPEKQEQSKTKIPEL